MRVSRKGKRKKIKRVVENEICECDCGRRGESHTDHGFTSMRKRTDELTKHLDVVGRKDQSGDGR